MKLSEKIFYLRKQGGKSQEELAEQMGVSRQAVSKWETGDAAPESSKLILLAESFGVTVDWLLSEEETLPTSGSHDREFMENPDGVRSGRMSEIDWSYPVYLTALFLFTIMMIVFVPHGTSPYPIVDFSNIANFIDYPAFLGIAGCMLLLLFACGLIKPLGQAFGLVLRKSKRCDIDIALSRRAVNTAMLGCLLGSFLTIIILFGVMMSQLSSSYMEAVSILSALIICSCFYAAILLLILMPVSIRLKQYLA